MRVDVARHLVGDVRLPVAPGSPVEVLGIVVVATRSLREDEDRAAGALECVDQPGVAARIAYRKTGVVTSLDKLTPDHLSELLDEVLINPAYRTNAKSLQRKIIEANGLAVAADIVEEALGIKEKSNAF